MNVIDLFSGVGGFSSGFAKKGFDIVLANEINEQIAHSYKINHPQTMMINVDIKNFTEDIDNIIQKELLKFEDKIRAEEIAGKLKDVDVIIGGPPCQGFSMAGARIRKSHSFIEDERNYLFKYYFKLIQKFEPKYFIMENVQGLETMRDGMIIEEIVKLFSDADNFENGKYYLSKMIIAADQLGVPQGRKRFILIGSKYNTIEIAQEINKLKAALNIPELVTVEDAISDLAYLESGQGAFEADYINETLTEYQKQRRKNSSKLHNHTAPRHNELVIERIKKIKQGENWTSLKDESIKSVHSGAYGRLVWDSYAPTITTRFDTPSAGRVVHPLLHRALTPREAARIQSFDDDFVFYGNKTSVGKQIGNAVPPLVAEVLAQIIKQDYEKYTIENNQGDRGR